MQAQIGLSSPSSTQPSVRMAACLEASLPQAASRMPEQTGIRYRRWGMGGSPLLVGRLGVAQ
jgi:hypothetical protein